MLSEATGHTLRTVNAYTAKLTEDYMGFPFTHDHVVRLAFIRELIDSATIASLFVKTVRGLL